MSGFSETLLRQPSVDAPLTYHSASGRHGRGTVSVQQELNSATQVETQEKDSETDVVSVVDRETETGMYV